MEELVLLPGLICDAAVWHHQVAALSKSIHITIPDYRAADTPAALVSAVLHQAPRQFSLAGHSMGGWVALEIMRTAPERVTRLCLINTTAAPDTPEKAAARHEMIAQFENGKRDEVIHRILSAFVYHESCRAEVKAMLLRNSDHFIHQECAMLMREDTIPILAAIDCPTTILHAANDAVFTNLDANLLHDNINHSSLSIIENCGHMSPLEASEAVTNQLQIWMKK